MPTYGYMIIGNRLSKKNTFNLTINNNVISQLNTVKYLDVILDNNLTSQPHIDKLSKKTFKILWHGYQTTPLRTAFYSETNLLWHV